MKLKLSIPYVYSIPIIWASILVMIMLAACDPATGTLSQATATLPQATATLPRATATLPHATATLPQATATVPQASSEPVQLPLSELGPYFPGKRTFTFEDTSRENREVSIDLWYPAVRPEGYKGTVASDAVPDLGGKPYPLILSSTKTGNIFAPHLASHGFVVAGVSSKMDPAGRWDLWLIDYPLDIVFAINQLASNPLGGLESVIDTNHAGVMGYSFDGYNALALSGARVDPKFYSAQCTQAPTMETAPPEWWIEYICDMAVKWDEFEAHAGEAITISDDGLWQPMTDERIRAAMPMAPEGAWLFGERGLGVVNRPTLIIGATKDDLNIYNFEAAYIFEHLGTPDSTMISFVGKDHMMIFDNYQVARMKHFSTAFFGYYLQMLDDYAGYFSEDFIAQYDDLAWGVYTGE